MAGSKVNLPEDLISWKSSDGQSNTKDASGGNNDEKVLMGFLDDSKDQVTSESSIPLSPQWLYSKPSESKAGLLATLGVLMATNCINILDQTLLRPDQIDRKIEFPNPNEESRFNILKIHSRKMKLMRGIDLKKISEKMNGASGAELNQMGQTLKSIGSL